MGLQPTELLVPFACVIGAFVGSFLNVCIYRLPRENLHLFRPAWSRCTYCLTTIRWYDNIPILGWLLLRGRCRDCKVPIGIRYPMVEALTAALFGLTALQVMRHQAKLPGESQAAIFAVQAYLISCLIAATFIDLDLRIIPDEITFLGMFLAPIAGFALPCIHGPLEPLSPTSTTMAGLVFSKLPGLHAFLDAHDHVRGLSESLLGMATGSGSVWSIGVLGKILFRKEAMGFGDVKYMAFLGGLLGWKAILVTFILAAIVGAVCGVLAFLATRDRTMAFGPYLSFGALVMTLWPRETEKLYLDAINCVGGWMQHGGH